MKKDFAFYRTLFSSTFFISAFTVGGGAVIIPLLQEKFVEDLKWIEQDEMLDMVAIAQSAPGVMAVNASIIIGYRLAGVGGALLTVLGTILPPLITLSIISIIYNWFSSNPYVVVALRGMQAGVAAVMLDVTWTLSKKVTAKKKALFIAMMLAATAVAIFTDINIVFIILVCGAIGGINTVIALRRKKEEQQK